MYTYVCDKVDFGEDYYFIYDPNHKYICSVDSEVEAEALISHLNRK